MAGRASGHTNGNRSEHPCPSRRTSTHRAKPPRAHESLSYQRPAVWTKDPPRAKQNRGALKHLFAVLGKVLLSLVALLGKGLVAVLRGIGFLVARSRVALVALIVVVVMLVGGLVDFGMNANKAYSGVRVGHIDASGKTVDELTELIDTTYGTQLSQGSVTIYANDEAEARIADEGTAAQDEALSEQLAVEEARANKLSWTAEAASLGAQLPAHELATKALAVGREDGGILARIDALISGRDIEPHATYAEDALETLASGIDAAIGEVRVDFGIAVQDGVATVTKGHDGNMVDRDDLRKWLDGAFFGQEDGRGSFVAHTEYAPLRVDEAAAQAACTSVNTAIGGGALFTFEDATWRASATDIGSWIGTYVEGSSLEAFVDPAKAKPALLAHVAEVSKGNKVRASFEVSDDEVRVRTEDGGTIPLVSEAVAQLDDALFGDDGKASTGSDAPVDVGIDSGPAPEVMSFDEAMDLGAIGVIASYTTQFNTAPGTEARNHNIGLVSKVLSNSVVKPGDSWSFNATAGNCSLEARGFEGAGAIVDGEYDDAVGGGICQAATTMFNAVYDAGFPILTRHNHSLYIASYPAGRDAAVSWPDLDLKWQNDSDSDVLVRLSCAEGSLTATLYGVNPGYRVSTATGAWSEGEKYETKHKLDEGLAPNASRVKTRGADGRSITVVRTVKDESGAILHKDSFNSEYDPVTEVVIEGPKAEKDEKGEAVTDGTSSNVTSN